MDHGLPKSQKLLFKFIAPISRYALKKINRDFQFEIHSFEVLNIGFPEQKYEIVLPQWMVYKPTEGNANLFLA